MSQRNKSTTKQPVRGLPASFAQTTLASTGTPGRSSCPLPSCGVDPGLWQLFTDLQNHTDFDFPLWSPCTLPPGCPALAAPGAACAQLLGCRWPAARPGVAEVQGPPLPSPELPGLRPVRPAPPGGAMGRGEKQMHQIAFSLPPESKQEESSYR